MSTYDPLIIGDLLVGAPVAGIGTIAPPAAPPPAGPPGPTTVGGLSADQASGKAIILAVLRQYKLDSPEVIAYATELATGSRTAAEMQARLSADLYDPASTIGKVVAQKYPAIFTRQNNGQAPISIAEYVSYADTARQLAEQFDLPQGFVDDKFIDDRIAGNVSNVELRDKFALYQRAAYETPADERAELERLYGPEIASAGSLAAYIADTKRAQPLIERQFLAAQQSATARRTGFGPLSQTQAEQLADLGVTGQAAQEGFGQLVAGRELFQALPGETADIISTEEQIAATFGGNAAAQERIRRKAEARRARMESGGGFSTGRAGVGGLGSAAS